MFDISFFELLIIMVVALIVIGPERLPRVARHAGRWVGRARRSLTRIKEEIDRELRAEELKEILRKQGDAKALERLLDPPAKPGQTEARERTAGGGDAALPKDDTGRDRRGDS
ncbi:Sec-independent protein translocase protein TatB [Thioalkalicoccus limnaeus]|uniref:Sec-independent protein translocase protein TatB n=1 Tax=Thioalkalicoccus limnaeus TaxID=120681 RepID=A0ABV4BBC5_9GAMM